MMDHALNSAGVFNKLAELYQAKYMDISAYTPELDKFIELLQQTSPSILEIACGPGNITQYILQKLPGAKILGTDLAPRMVELAKHNCPAADFKVMDCRNIHSIAKKFDGIIAGFCLPYLDKTEVIRLLKDIAGLLNDRGILYVSTIEGSYSDSGLKKGSTGDEVFMHYYESAAIEGWLLEAGLELISISRVSVAGNPHQDTDLILLAQK